MDIGDDLNLHHNDIDNVCLKGKTGYESTHEREIWYDQSYKLPAIFDGDKKVILADNAKKENNLPVAPTNPETYFLNANKEWAEIQIGHNQLSDLNGDNDYLHVTSGEKSTWSGKQDALIFSNNIETDKASTTKISAIKTFYDWAVAKFLLATKLVTSWSGTPSNESIPSEKLVYDELVDLDANKYDKSAADLLLVAKEDIINKSSNVDTDKTSTTKYANVKAIYDWAVGKFVDLAKIVTSWSATPLDANIPSEKLVKDGLDSKFNLSGGNSISGNQNFDSNTFFVDSVNHRVGIGTTTPTARLGITGAGTGTGVVFRTAGSTNSPGITVLDSGKIGNRFSLPVALFQTDTLADRQYADNGSKPTWRLSYSGTPVIDLSMGNHYEAMISNPYSGGSIGGLQFRTGGLDTTFTRMTISQTGKVGIGTTTPATKLDVNGTSNFADNMNILSTKNQYLAASPTSDTVNDIRVRNDSGVLKTERCTVANATKGAGTWVDESKADITPATGATSALRALFTSVPNANCVYNTATGYYEMNGITDLTEADMMKSYYVLNPYRISAAAGAYQGSKIRTNFYLGPLSNIAIDGRYWHHYNTTLEVFKMHRNVFFSSTAGMFYNCTNLVTAETFGMILITNAVQAVNMFFGCVKLATMYLYQLKVAFSFEWSPLLSLDSLQYLVNNRTNGTTRITITVHPTVWDKLNDAVNYPEWNALLVDAHNNQYIDFASA